MTGRDEPLRPPLIRRDDGVLIAVPTDAWPPRVTLDAGGLFLYLAAHAQPPARDALIASPPSELDEPAKVRAAYDELVAAGVWPPATT